MRTGSIGNRDAETIINTLVEPKKSALMKVRSTLLVLGYEEEAGYDAINIESYVSYSKRDAPTFLLKHKWELSVVLVLKNKEEKDAAIEKFPELTGRQLEENQDDGTFWMKLDPIAESQLIIQLGEFYARVK